MRRVRCGFCVRYRKRCETFVNLKAYEIREVMEACAV